MKTMITMMSKCGVVLAAIIAVLSALPAHGAAFEDRIVLKDGRVLLGTIVREVEGYLWVRTTVGGIEKEEMIAPVDVSSVERDAKADPVSAAPVAPKDAATPKPRRSGVPRAAVITLGDGGEKDMVGLFMTAKAIEDAIPILKEEGVSVVVFRVKSGGGALLEIQKLSDVIHNRYKNEFDRVVAWIESAISAAAMTAHCLEEIYMMPQGNYGACTGWYGQLNAVKGRELEEVLYMMERISARGKHDPKIMRAMQITADQADFNQLEISSPTGALSATITPDGDVVWYQDSTSGEHVLNPKGGVKVLTFNAEEAVKFKFARGIAKDLQELTKLLGYNELEWVGEPVKGVAWPVSKAERLQVNFRDQVLKDQTLISGYWSDYQINLQAAQAAQDKQERGKFVNRARQHFERIKRMVKNNPNFTLFVFNMTDEQFKEWVEQQEKIMRDLMR